MKSVRFWRCWPQTVSHLTWLSGQCCPEKTVGGSICKTVIPWVLQGEIGQVLEHLTWVNLPATLISRHGRYHSCLGVRCLDVPFPCPLGDRFMPMACCKLSANGLCFCPCGFSDVAMRSQIAEWDRVCIVCHGVSALRLKVSFHGATSGLLVGKA